MIRPQPARWFEVVAAGDDAPRALAALAATGAVELEPRSARASDQPIAALLPMLAAFDDLALRYAPYWPRANAYVASTAESPLQTLERGLAGLREWTQRAEPIVQRLQAIEHERAELMLWQRVLGALADAPIDFEQLGRPGPVVHKRLFVFPERANVQLPPGLIARHIDHDGMLCTLVVGTDEALGGLAQQCAALHGQVHAAPAWLQPEARASLAYVPPRLHALEREQASLEAELDALTARYGVAGVLGEIHCLQWLAQNVRALEASALFCWITGWTSDLTGIEIAHALDQSGARALLHFPAPPPGREPPLLLRNPWWARPFEIFSRALGMPSRNEADPSVLLAVAVPLMFGYMFGDVGQGLVIAAVAYALRKRYPVARLLVAGGVAAALFGVVFGSSFGLHSIDAMWVRPLDAPLPVLLVPLLGGALLLLIGLGLGATEAHWRGELGHWLATDGGLALAYASLLASPFVPAMLAGCVIGFIVHSAGEGVHARSAAAAVAAIAQFVERIIQLLINTLSFARVGAFALAHAGLSSAIVALTDATDGVIARALVLVLGNAIVLALETMVVSIQTTRLVLFEFFTRFLVAEGRVFRPLLPPPELSSLQEM